MLTDLQPSPTTGNAALLRVVESGPAGLVKARCPEFAGIRASVVRAGRDAVLVAQADPADYSFLVISGCLRTVRLMSDGRRQIGAFLFPGDFFGLEALNEHTFGMEAVGPAILRRYLRCSLEAYADRNMDFARRLRTMSAKRLRSEQARVLALGRMTASERIARFLLEMAHRTDASGPCIELPMSRADVADYLGLTTETVCRMLTQMQREAIIAINRSLIAIKDGDALAALAGE
ncbi:MAG: helix-turn-helix domain-containing protein [Alphaproteobacteria bacterium]|nr:helix-turn-helix domain-containing protein [Alphaproteobacteria bacterium]